MNAECDEVADTLNPAGIKTFSDALAAVTRQMGPPDEIGYTIHNNVAWSLYQSAKSKQ